MAVIQKRRKTGKNFHKSNPYPENLNHHDHGYLKSDFHFNPGLKTSQYSDKEHIENGGNPVFNFPIPKSDPLKATMLNDEVDMYFPRKHFLTKFQMNHDLLDNILTKPIPTNKIIPPRMFPLPFVEGIPYEKKKSMLLQGLKKSNSENPVVNEGVTKTEDIKNKEKAEEDKDKHENTEDRPVEEKPSQDEKAVGETGVEEIKLDSIKDEDKNKEKDEDKNKEKDEDEDTGKDKDEDGDEDKNGNHNNENTNDNKAENKVDNTKDGNREENNLEQVATIGTNIEDGNNIDDENLSDYDPDYDHNQIEYPKMTKEADIIENYLQSRILLKEPTDFIIGDLRTMQILESITKETSEKLEKAMNEPIKLNRKFKYNMEKIDQLRSKFNKFTANSINELDETINTIELEIKDKFSLKFNESEKVRQFKTAAFDSIKVGITLDEYNEKYKSSVESEKSLNPLASHPHVLPISASSDRNTDLNSKQSHNENEFYKSQSFEFDNNMLYESNTFGHDEDDDQFNSLNNQVFL